MSPAKSNSQPAARRSVAFAVAGAVVLLVIVGLAYWAWSDTPQLSTDSEVYVSLDALFTAVTARREPLLSECESQLAALHREGRIPAPAWKKITRVITLARTGSWESAAKDLYTFLEHQKRAT